jgi:cell division protein FtsA
MKLKYGSAHTDNHDIDNSLKYSIDSGRQVESRKFIEIVEGRLEEIIENVWYQIPNDYYDKLLGGIILTGGGSNMKNIEQAFINHTHVDKIRVAKFVTNAINATQEDIKAKDGRMNTLLGLLAKGDRNCAGRAISQTGDLFDNKREPQAMQLNSDRQARQASETPQGVVRTEIEKQKADEEARRKKEEEDRIRQEQEEAERQRIAREKKENSFWNKALKGIKQFGKTIIEEE